MKQVCTTRVRYVVKNFPSTGRKSSLGLSVLVAACVVALTPCHTSTAENLPLPAWDESDTSREQGASLLLPPRGDIFQGATSRPEIALPTGNFGEVPSAANIIPSGSAGNVGAAVRNIQNGNPMGSFRTIGGTGQQGGSLIPAVGQIGGAVGAGRTGLPSGVNNIMRTVQSGAQVMGAVGQAQSLIGRFREGGTGAQNIAGMVGGVAGVNQAMGGFGQGGNQSLGGILQGLRGQNGNGMFGNGNGFGNGMGVGPFGQFMGQNNQLMQGMQFVALLQQVFGMFFPANSALQFNNANTGQSARTAFVNLMGANGSGTGSTGNFPSANLPYDGSCANPSGVGSIADGQINQNFSNYVMSIGARETGFSAREANSDYYNQVETVPGQSYANSNVRRGVQQEGLTLEQAQARYGDYGYFQTNQADVEHAVRLGVPRETASAMNNGGGNGTYSPQEQARATALYIQAYNPAAAEAASRGDYDTANRLLNGKWPSLPGGRSHRPGNDACANRFLQGSSNGLT